MNTALEQSILKTLAYFDIFSHPLTREELYHYLWGYHGNVEKVDFSSQLESLTGRGVEHKWGYYFLPGRGEIVEKRRRSVLGIEKKMKIAKRAVKKIRWVPFVRAVFVCNTTAASTASEVSDIDVFIIARHGRIWIVRFLVTIVLSIFRLRRTGKKINNRICLSFYLSDNHLNLKDISIKKPDIYLMYWLAQLIPVFDPGQVYKKIKLQNKWVLNFAPRAFGEYTLLNRWKVVEGRLSALVKKFFEKAWGTAYGDFLESQAKEIQSNKMKRNLTSVQDKPDTRVVVNDHMLKFHENDRRGQFKQEWLEKTQTYGV